MKTADPSKVLFGFSCFLLVFIYGFAVRHYRIFPFSIIDGGVEAARQVFAERETLAGIRPVELTQPARQVGKGVTRNQPGKAAPGLTFITSFFDDGNEMRLIRLDGSVVHRWPVRFFDIFPNQDHIDPQLRPQSEWNVNTHGAVLLPDGSIVFSFENLGLAKIDRCGTVQWTVPRMTHHSVERSQDGGYWVPSATYVKDGNPDRNPFPLLRPVYTHDAILKVSADGKVLAELSVLNLFFKNHLEALLYPPRAETFGYVRPRTTLVSQDLTHLNDVEELMSAMAPSFPQFRAGDLLLSLKVLNMLMVIDPRTETVKWHQTGPWIGQHDPDFQPSGRISVFNNNSDSTETGSILGGSEIVDVDPATGQTAIRYGGTPEQKWFSFRRGKHQYLPGGNILITDSESGRVFEVDREGDIVWEFINRYDDRYVAVIRTADRFPEDYFTVKQWDCE